MASITLAGKAYDLKPLTIGQLRILLPAVQNFGGVDQTVAIIKAALMRDYGADAANLDNMESTVAEMSAAVETVLKLAGLVPSGEVQAPA